MRLLAFGTYDTQLHPRVEVLLQGLRAHGDEIVEVNVPLRLNTAARVAMLQQPWRLPSLALKLLACWLRLIARGRRVAQAAPPQAVIVGYLGHFDVHLARFLFGKTPIALDQLVFAADTARDRGIGRGWKTRLLGRLDRAAVNRADLVAVDTDEHRALAFQHHADRAVVTPVGATTSWFTAATSRNHADRSNTEPLRVIFFGLFTPLQGTPVLGQALRMLTDSTNVHVLMVGHGQDYACTRALAAGASFVQWRDWVPIDELAELTATYDVCLGIFGGSPKAMRVVPNKIYQGAAAGCAIVTSDTEPQRRALGNAAHFVPPGDAMALADALRTLAGDRGQLRTLQAAARGVADRSFRPEIVVRPFRECLIAMTTAGRRDTMSDR